MSYANANYSYDSYTNQYVSNSNSYPQQAPYATSPMYKYTQPSLNVYTSPSLSGYSPTTDYGGVAMRPSQSHSSTSSYESKQSSCLQDYSSPASSLEEYPENQFGNDIELNFEFAGSKQRGKSDKHSPHLGTARQFHCLSPGCDHTSKREFDLDRHVKTNHRADLELFACPGKGCGRQGPHGFKRKDHMTEHLRKVHNKENEYPKTQTRRKDSSSLR